MNANAPPVAQAALTKSKQTIKILYLKHLFG
jgi:hypothetical protein